MTLELARMVAPEDIRVGDCIAVLNAAEEIMAHRCEWMQTPPAVCTVWTCGSGDPLRVEAICLPFVLVTSASGDHSTLDVRLARLVRLSEHYALEAFKRLAPVKAQPPECTKEGE